MFLDEENEDVVDTAENVEEQTTEEIVEGADVTTEEKESSTEKTYTEADIEKLVNERVDMLMPSKIERVKSKIQRENAKKEEKFNRVEKILNAGLGTDNLDDAISKLSDFYNEQGVEIPKEPIYSEKQLMILAEAEAREIIDSGYDEIVLEVDRLASKGVKNMTELEKITFQKLAEARKHQESINELNKIGVSLEELDNKEYKEFSEKLNSNMSEKEKYEMYLKFKPKKEIKQIGSMKSGARSEIKDYYTPDEVDKLTEDELNNDEVWNNVRKSMSKWK